MSPAACLARDMHAQFITLLTAIYLKFNEPYKHLICAKCSVLSAQTPSVEHRFPAAQIASFGSKLYFEGKELQKIPTWPLETAHVQSALFRD